MSIEEARDAFFERNPFPSLLTSPYITADEDGPTGVAMAMDSEVVEEMAKRLCLDLVAANSDEEQLEAFRAWTHHLDGDLAAVCSILMCAIANLMDSVTHRDGAEAATKMAIERWADDIPDQYKAGDLD